MYSIKSATITLTYISIIESISKSDIVALPLDTVNQMTYRVGAKIIYEVLAKRTAGT